MPGKCRGSKINITEMVFLKKGKYLPFLKLNLIKLFSQSVKHFMQMLSSIQMWTTDSFFEVWHFTCNIQAEFASLALFLALTKSFTAHIWVMHSALVKHLYVTVYVYGADCQQIVFVHIFTLSTSSLGAVRQFWLK